MVLNRNTFSTLVVLIRREFSTSGGSNSSTMPVDTLREHTFTGTIDFNPVEERNLKVNLSRSLNFDYTAV